MTVEGSAPAGARASTTGLRVLAIGVATVVLDGYDIQAAAFAAPALSAEWGLDKAALGPVLAAALVGMAVGAFAGGPAGDRWGRRATLIASVVFFGMMSYAASFAAGREALMLSRLLTGIGLGAAIPNATALVAEWTPEGRRGAAVTAVNVGVPAGGMIGAALASWLIPQFGWRACFAVGGVLPLLLAGYMAVALPESASFLAARNRRAPVAGVADEAGWRGLVTRGYRRSTFGLWLAFFANMAAVYTLFNWIPTLLASLGYPVTTALRGAMVFNLFGVLGSFGGAWLVRRAGSRPALLLLSAIAVSGIGALAGVLLLGEVAPLRVMAALALAGVGVLGVQVGMYVLAAEVYPTECRSTGVGWAAGCGRLGSLVSAFGAAAVVALDPTDHLLFAALGVALGLAALATLLVDRHVGPAR
jgi:AAHS family 4-hydroxybenzoate transporter-like MFS transporter